MISMKQFSTTALLAATLSTGMAATAAPAPKTAGTIIIREKDTSVECSIPTTPGDHSLKENSCTNDQAYTVRFVKVPSALNITFFNDEKDGKCFDNEGWEIEVRTIKDPTTTPAEAYMNIESMANAADDSIIEAGVLKIRYRADGAIHGKLSCVRIEDNK